MDTGGAAPDLVYAIGDAIHVHIHPEGTDLHYTVVEPPVRPEQEAAMARVRDLIFKEALLRPGGGPRGPLEQELLTLFDRVSSPPGRNGNGALNPERQRALRYYVLRDVARYGPIEPLTHDPYLEDIQAVGTQPIHVVHKFYGMMRTNIQFARPEELDLYLRNLSERIGRPVSDARPIVDATLSDGSRINIVYSEDVSRKGPSFSIRRVTEEPISITQLIAWRTLSARLAAYLWICLENGINVFVCGESACGKTATLNALLPFIAPRAKIYSAEDTPEVRPPHPVWQRLLTRESGPEEARVKMFDLLKAALRSRPNCIVVGEIRGAEGAVAFQAMQTGHQTVATLHAADISKMVQRLSAPPISIPLTFMDNLNVGVFQQVLERNGRPVRRVVSVDELEGYSAVDVGILTRKVFAYDGVADEPSFRGHNNSFILEQKVAAQHGYDDPREIYDVLGQRTRILQGLVDRGVLRYDDVNRILFDVADRGVGALPFSVT